MTDEAHPWSGLEPNARSGHIPPEHASLFSIAISLKRIADRLCGDNIRPGDTTLLAEIFAGRN